MKKRRKECESNFSNTFIESNRQNTLLQRVPNIKISVIIPSLLLKSWVYFTCTFQVPVAARGQGSGGGTFTLQPMPGPTPSFPDPPAPSPGPTPAPHKPRPLPYGSHLAALTAAVSQPLGIYQSLASAGDRHLLDHHPQRGAFGLRVASPSG